MQLDSSSLDSTVQVFIHHSPDPENPAILLLTAEDIDLTSAFQWSKLDTVSFSFESYHADSNTKTSVINNLDPGCYRVHISSDSSDTVMTAWVYRNSPVLEVEKTEDGKIKTYQAPCVYLWLKAEAGADTLRYYDFSADSMKTIPNDISTEWTLDDPEYELFGATRYINLTIPNDPPNSRPPTKDVTFKLTVTDSFGLTLDDEVLYESVHTKADFIVLIEDVELPGTWIEEESPIGEAPLEVKFLNQSENGVEFYWTFIDSAKTGSVEKDTTYDVADTAVFIYYIPQNYYPSLVSVSHVGCEDSLKMVNEIYVENSEVDVPNAFSPKITIFNRWGNLVYEHVQTEDKFDWQGWDGTLNGRGNVHCEPGVYFFVIEAIGWDKEKYRGRDERGFVYLYRDNIF